MSSFRADLHCHTTCSDGSLTPAEVVRLAVDIGLSGLSITDHDSIAAYGEALPEAQKLGIPLLTGVEFSTAHRGVAVHVLAYGFALESPAIRDLCRQHVQRRKERNQEILDRLTALGMPLTEEEVYAAALSSEQDRSWGRPHIAQAMIKKGYARDSEDAFRKYIGDGKSAFASGKTFSVEETIEIIHQAGGYAILAHPMLVEKNSVVRDLLCMPFDGLEAYYAKFPLDRQRYWQDVARGKGWMVTGGSDFHGKHKPNIPLGCSWVGEETFNMLFERMKR